jgi:hypothetical protein
MESKPIKLEHLAPYLPYGLESASVNVGKYGVREPFVERINADNVMKYLECHPFRKPILRPIKDLFDPTKDHGIQIYKYYCFQSLKEFKPERLPYKVFVKLLKNHFDVFGLIGKGQAFSYWEIYKEEK